MDIKEILENIIELKDLVIERGRDLLTVDGINRNYYDVDGVTFGKESITIFFSDANSYDITLEMLEMEDKKWAEYLNKLKIDKEEKKRVKEEERIAFILKQKEDRLNYLVKELEQLQKELNG